MQTEKTQQLQMGGGDKKDSWPSTWYDLLHSAANMGNMQDEVLCWKIGDH